MFEKVQERAAANLLRDAPEDQALMAEMLAQIAEMTPEQASFIPYSALCGASGPDGTSPEQVADFRRRSRMIAMLCSIPGAPLAAVGYVLDANGAPLRVSSGVMSDAMNAQAGSHPATGEPVANLAGIVHLAFELRPEYAKAHAQARLHRTPDHA